MGTPSELDAAHLWSIVSPLRSEPPHWLQRLVPPSEATLVDERWPLEAVSAGPLMRLTARIRQCRDLDADVLTACVREAYVSIGSALAAASRHPIRFWNFVPGIGDRFGDLDRYMVFNRGRYDALSLWHPLASRSRLDTSLATSSAVGVDADDLVIDCLASTTPGRAVENPRQISSWCYSPCYGPRPPCFARATIAMIDGVSWLLVGGTASIVGEESRHEEALDDQLDETFRNLAALVGSVCRAGDDPLSRISDARVYIARAADAGTVVSMVTSRMRAAHPVEFVRATICRPELLVEIEGRVRLTPLQA
jgi:chorismate lyase/3-hydroxybenzoate synthase